MRYLFPLITATLLFSCAQGPQKQATETPPYAVSPSSAPSKAQGQVATGTPGETKDRCKEYFQTVSPSYPTRIAYLEQVLAENSDIPAVNQTFLRALIREMKKPDSAARVLTIRQALFPVFKRKKREPGIFAFPVYSLSKNKDLTEISPERELIPVSFLQKIEPKREELNQKGIKDVLVKGALDSLFTENPPGIHLFSFRTSFKGQVKNLHYSASECVPYYRYSFPVASALNDADLLLGSPYELALIYENDPKIDSVMRSQYLPCEDCPSDGEISKTFARVKGTDNLFFTYEDTFPINDSLDAPSRSLVISTNGKVVNLWGSELDLFGCQCL